MLEVKGMGILSHMSYVKDTFGEEGYSKWCAALSNEARELVEDTVLTSSWYDGKIAAIELRKKICDVFFDGDVIGARHFGRYSADRGLRGVYKVFVKLGSPAWLIERMGKVFTKYFRPGRMYATELTSNSVRVRLDDFPEHSRYIEETLCGYMEQAIIISGMSSATAVLDKSVRDGDEHDEFLITWTR